MTGQEPREGRDEALSRARLKDTVKVTVEAEFVGTTSRLWSEGGWSDGLRLVVEDNGRKVHVALPLIAVVDAEIVGLHLEEGESLCGHVMAFWRCGLRTGHEGKHGQWKDDRHEGEGY